MKLYVVRGDLDFAWLQPAGEGDWSWRGGVPVSWAWREPEFTLPAETIQQGFLPVDCLAMNTGADGLILSDYARDKLHDLLSPAGEFWPVRVLGHRYWWFNCLARVDGLDPARTEADWGVVEGEWGEFRWITSPRRLAFRVHSVRAAPTMFRVPEFPQGFLFGRESLERAVQTHRLTGFRFDLVWRESTGGVCDPPGFGFHGVFDDAAPGALARKRANARALLEQRARRGGEELSR